jgi:GNAT superfamily N-acetyltransferase
MSITATIRAVTPQDDMVFLTDLIHAAYMSLAEKNLRYWATHQSVADTTRRFSSGHGLIAEVQGKVVGTLTVRPPQPDSEVPQYRDATTWTLGQFAVSPELQGSGIGHQLHEVALAYAWTKGGRIIALDTAVSATHLIEMYVHWGYKIVGECDWRPQTNYLSVIMSRSISVGVSMKNFS